METGYIPPNLHYKTPRAGIEPLEKGRMIVVSEKLPLPDDKGLFGMYITYETAFIVSTEFE